MNNLTKYLTQNILLEIHTGNKRVIAFFSGRFQPFAKQHKHVYDFMKSKFPESYILTSNSTKQERSPLTFEEKKMIMIKSGVTSTDIKFVKTPYQMFRIDKTTGKRIYHGGWEDILKNYDATNTVLVFLIGLKDGQRLITGQQYLKNFKTEKKYNGFDKNAYYYVIPNLEIGNKIASSTTIRHTLSSDALSIKEKKQFFDNMMATTDDTIFKLLLNKFNNKINESKKLLTCGGAFGHMSHVYEDKELTFADLKNIIIKSLNGQLSNEIIEKVDGQNLMISWKDNRLIFARNLSHLKNFGENALTVDDIKSKFKGREGLSDAFSFAADDLSNAISSLTDAQKNKIFMNGKRFMNLEILWPETTNVIPYNMKMIIFHNFREYDKDGRVVDGDFHESARILAGMIKQLNKDIQQNFKIASLSPITLPKVKDFNIKKEDFLTMLSQIENKYHLLDTDKLKKYFSIKWFNIIKEKAKLFNYNISKIILKKLIKRFAFSDKSYSINDMRQDISNTEFLNWVTNVEKGDEMKQIQQDVSDPIKNIFLKLSIEVLSNISTFLAPNRKKVVQDIKNQIDTIKNDIQSSNDIGQLEKLETELQRIEKLGGFDNIIPSEGVVFLYEPIGNKEPKLYKYTGTYGPVNQILGIKKYARV